MHDPVFPISVLCLVILLLNFLLKRFHQPYLIGYILAGILLGRHALHILADGDDIATLGSLGVLLLMFFLGMEIDIPDRKSLLLKPIIAQSVKTCLSLFFSLVICHLFHLNFGTMILLTILLAFNSTAVVSELLRQNHGLHSDTGKTLLNMLFLQDIMLTPVLTLLSQTGEFSLFACTLAHNSGLIDAGLYKGTIAVIVLSLLISTPWPLSFRKFVHRPSNPIIPKKTYTCL
jgi:CPA2 family monovalent cation:H+ antiporter-2